MCVIRGMSLQQPRLTGGAPQLSVLPQRHVPSRAPAPTWPWAPKVPPEWGWGAATCCQRHRPRGKEPAAPGNLSMAGEGGCLQGRPPLTPWPLSKAAHDTQLAPRLSPCRGRHVYAPSPGGSIRPQCPELVRASARHFGHGLCAGARVSLSRGGQPHGGTWARSPTLDALSFSCKRNRRGARCLRSHQARPRTNEPF